MAKAKIAPAPAHRILTKERKRFRIARQGATEEYSMQFSEGGQHWETSIRNLDLKRATKQLDRLRDLGCPTAKAIAVIQ